MKHADKIFSYAEKGIIIVLLTFMTIMNFVNVMSRYLLAQSMSFSEELILIAFIWVSMLGTAAAYRKGAHLGMGLITEYLPASFLPWFTLFGTACSVGLISTLFVYGIDLIRSQIMLNATTPALALPAWVESSAIPVGCVFMLVRVLQFGVTEFIRLRAAAPGGK